MAQNTSISSYDFLTRVRRCLRGAEDRLPGRRYNIGGRLFQVPAHVRPQDIQDLRLDALFYGQLADLFAEGGAHHVAEAVAQAYVDLLDGVTVSLEIHDICVTEGARESAELWLAVNEPDSLTSHDDTAAGDQGDYDSTVAKSYRLFVMSASTGNLYLMMAGARTRRVIADSRTFVSCLTAGAA